MGALNIDSLDFDPTAVSEGPTIGSYIVSSGGNVITDSANALDVNIQSSDVDLQIDLDLNGSIVDDDSPDTEDPLKIGYRAHNTSSPLGSVSADGDKANAISDLYRRSMINDAPNIAGSNEAISVTDAVGGVALPTTPLAGRTRMIVQNLGSDPSYLGFGTVTVANGIRLGKNTNVVLEIGEALALKAIAPATKTNDTRIMELA